jgi:hypothetical protein
VIEGKTIWKKHLFTLEKKIFLILNKYMSPVIKINIYICYISALDMVGLISRGVGDLNPAE